MIPNTESLTSREELALRGDKIYESDVRPLLGAHDNGKFVLIDVRSGDYEIDADEIVASDRLLSRWPQAQVWLRQVGAANARRFGSRPLTARTLADRR